MDIKKLEQYIDTYSQISQSIMNSMYIIQKDNFRNSIITPDQFNLMNVIKTNDACTSSFLAKALNVKKSSITAIVNRLADKGLINRVFDEKDRRVVFLELTDEGQDVLNEKRGKLINKLMPLGYDLTEEELDKLMVNLSLIAAQLKSIEKEVIKDEE
ncbi:MAG: MarR family transcriptional regulator [Shouchella clausii]|jgi:DNA-binding MarR family transcriptional regulator